MSWQVVDNVTDRAASKAFDTEDKANMLCRGLNLQHGPGGRYGVREVTPGACGCSCHDEAESGKP
jgi:hypothetical protein